jgi:peptidyl-prolyl cis-trans isomerase C
VKPDGDRLAARALGWVKAAAGQPLVQFAVLGGALFWIMGTPVSAPDQAAITVDPALRERLSRFYQVQMGAYPSQAEVQSLVDRHVRDEMFYREAMRLGLDKDDEIVRRRLVQKMEFLAEREGDKATEAQLREFWQAHPDQFGQPARTSLQQVYFDPDKAGWPEAEARARAVLKAGGEPVGDPSLFGEGELAKALQHARKGLWEGPYRSGYGWHLIRVTEREAAATESFDSVRDAVQRAWVEEARLKQLDKVLAELKARYKVVERQ